MLARKVSDDIRRGVNKFSQFYIRDVYMTGPRNTGPRSNNGVHISLDLRKLITTEMVNILGWLASVKSDRFRGPGWLRNVTVKVPGR